MLKTHGTTAKDLCLGHLHTKTIKKKQHKKCSVWTGPNSRRSVPLIAPQIVCIPARAWFPLVNGLFWEWRVSCGRMQSQPPCLKTEPLLVNLLQWVPTSAQSASLLDRSRRRLCLLCWDWVKARESWRSWQVLLTTDWVFMFKGSPGAPAHCV